MQVSGCFWNYFSVGLDAEAAYGFHRLREASPWAASTRLANQVGLVLRKVMSYLLCCL